MPPEQLFSGCSRFQQHPGWFHGSAIGSGDSLSSRSSGAPGWDRALLETCSGLRAGPPLCCSLTGVVDLCLASLQAGLSCLGTISPGTSG